MFLFLAYSLQPIAYSYLKALKISFPLAKSSKAIRMKNPTIWALSINFSLGFFRVIISYNKNITCPPSRAGIGSRFIIPSIIERNAVTFQKYSQDQTSGKTLKIA